MDIDTRFLMKSGYRITKERNRTAARIRIPGGDLQVEFLPKIKEVAEKYGRGVIHLSSRQGIEIPFLDINKLEEIKRELAEIIYAIESISGAALTEPEKGYKGVGCRNISACIGSQICRYANFDTTSLAKEIEARFFENGYHLKIGITGCPNDCAKIWVQDIGIIGIVEPQHNQERCVACEACFKRCKTFCNEAITMENKLPKRDENKCTYCGECILICPAMAWTRKKTMYKLVVGGRTGKKEVRLGRAFLDFVDDKEVIFKVTENTFKFIDRYIDRSLKKEHLGYIIDREGFSKYRDFVLRDISLNKEAIVYNY